eukprot:Platyproteum_vivax@DN3802_c0_g1_i1.p1
MKSMRLKFPRQELRLGLNRHILPSIWLGKKKTFQDASNQYSELIRLMLLSGGPYQEDVAKTYGELGMLQHHQKLYEDAIDSHQKSIKIWHKLVDFETEKVVEKLGEPGDLEKEGRESSSKASDEEEEEVREVPGSYDLEMAASYAKLGAVYNDLQDYDQALDLLQKSVAIRRKFLGANSLVLAESYNNLGALAMKQGEDRDAIDYFEDALRILLIHSETNKPNPYLAMTYANLGRMRYGIQSTNLQETGINVLAKGHHDSRRCVWSRECKHQGHGDLFESRL